MFTLMPVAAFAADITPAFGSIAEEYTNVETNEDVKVKLTKADTYYIYATKNGEMVKWGQLTGATTGSTIGLAIVEATVAANEEVTVQFTAAGEYEIGVAKAGNPLLADIISGAEGLVAPATVLNNLKTFAVTMVNNAVTVSDADSTYTVTVSDAGLVPGTTPGDKTVTLDADNGFTSETVNAYLTKTVGSNFMAAAGIDLKITTDSHAVTVTKIDKATKVDGIQRFKVSASIPGTYHVYVSYENAKDTYEVVVNPAGAVTVSTLAEPVAPKDKTNLDADETGILFEVTDATGYAYEGAAVGDTLSVPHNVTVVEAPVGFSKATQFKLVWGSENNVEGWELVAKADGSQVPLTKEGKYTFKVSLKNGASATASVTVAEFDEAVKIMFAQVPTTVVLDDNTFTVSTAQVQAVDANGVTTAATGLGTVTINAHGAAVDTFTNAGGVYTLDVKDAEKYIGSTITLIAVLGSGSDALTATTEIVVTEEASTVVYEDVEVPVGKNVTLYGDVVDSYGKVVNMAGASVQVIVLDKPENAVASVNPTSPIAADGKVEVKFLASAPGEYKIQTIVSETGKYISGIETIVVAGAHGAFNDVVVVSMGADSMIVNNELVKLDVAPFIENNRTMMQFNVLYVFGIDIKWVPETESVVAEGNGIKVVMNLGSKVATVNGEEVALDVAPYSVNGRTVVPVGFITGTFGINPAFTYNADGSIADIIFTAAK